MADILENNLKIELVNVENMKTKSRRKRGEIVGGKYSEEELRRFAESVIGKRMKFCSDYKKDEPFDKCVCEAIKRYIRLFTDQPMEGSKELSKLRLNTLHKIFADMKRDGKIICPEEGERKVKGESI